MTTNFRQKSQKGSYNDQRPFSEKNDYVRYNDNSGVHGKDFINNNDDNAMMTMLDLNYYNFTMIIDLNVFTYVVVYLVH